MAVSKCKHGIYLDGCRECFPLPDDIYDFPIGLSDDEIEKLAHKLLSPYFCMYDNIQFARAIEAKVRGEK